MPTLDIYTILYYDLPFLLCLSLGHRKRFEGNIAVLQYTCMSQCGHSSRKWHYIITLSIVAHGSSFSFFLTGIVVKEWNSDLSLWCLKVKSFCLCCCSLRVHCFSICWPALCAYIMMWNSFFFYLVNWWWWDCAMNILPQIF